MKNILSLILLLSVTACCSKSYKPGDSYYGRKVQKAFIDGCMLESRVVYTKANRLDLVDLAEKRCEEELKEYSQE